MSWLSTKTSILVSSGLFLFFGVLYFIWSYALVDGNLVLFPFSFYWQFQQYLWHQLLPNRPLLSFGYLMIVVGLFLSWALMVVSLKSLTLKVENQLKTWQVILAYLILALPFLLAYNALSYDLFNYIFNAKMVLVYHANPHVKTALDFSFDPWTRFMHNVHTPAPYGYGWTAISLLPYTVGLGKFGLTWFSFKLFSLISVIWLFFNLAWLASLLKLKLRLWLWASLLLNPLLVIEIIGNAHNDLWMMNFFLVAISLVIGQIKSKPTKFWRLKLNKLTTISLSVIAFFLAGWIKLASLITSFWYLILLLASFISWQRPRGLGDRLLVFWFKDKLTELIRLTPLLSSLLLFLLLLTDRSKRFLPWYLTWSLVFLPPLVALARQITVGVRRIDRSTNLDWLPQASFFWSIWLVSFSFSSLLRYFPWLKQGGYTDQVLSQQLWITWGVGLALFVVLYLITRVSRVLVYWLIH